MVLMPETVARLGSGPLCSFPNDSFLEIYLGYAAKIAPNDFITFKPTAIVNKERNSFYTTGSSIVERPAIAPKPKLVVRAPIILSVCDDYVIDASGSYGTAGRQLNFSFGVYPNVPNEHFISEMLTRYSEVGTVNVVTIPGNLLQPDITYRFVVSVKNFLREVTTKTIEVVRRSFPVPRVLVQGDPIPLEQAEAFVERLGVHLPDDSAASVVYTNERGRRRSRESTKEGYLAFVSHMKAEAAMEARFLQTELESRHEDEVVFLDSDDLRDLSKLIHHVQQSRRLVLVQTRNVLARPYCILELLTAIESQIPIVCVAVGGKPQEIAYNYEEITRLMTWMDTDLEKWNPGAADVLRDHGYEDLTDVAYRLSTIIPKTISVPLNTGDSRNRLHASIEDVVSAMKEARAPNLPDKAAWLMARSKMASPLKKVGGLKQHGI